MSGGGSEPTISVQFLRHVAHCVELTGRSPEPLLASIGLGRAQLDDAEHHIRLADFLSFFEEAARYVGNPHFGLQVGRLSSSDSLGALSFLFLSAPTLREAFGGFTRFLATMQQASANEFVEGQRWATFRYTICDQSLRHRRQDAEFSIGATYTLARQFTGGTLNLEEVRFEHELIGDYRRYEAYFGCEVFFSQNRNSFSFRRDLLDQPGRSLSPTLHPIIAGHLRLKLAESEAAEDIVARARYVIAASPLDRPTPSGDLARALGISVPTLVRRLRAAGTSYRRLLDERQMAAAQRLLSEGRRPVCDIAVALGYAESASFIRSFRRYHGVAPGHWRAQGR